MIHTQNVSKLVFARSLIMGLKYGGTQNAPNLTMFNIKLCEYSWELIGFSPSDFWMGDMGLQTSIIRRKVLMLRLWNRLLKMDNLHITKQLFDFDYTDNGKWSRQISKILIEIGEENKFQSKSLLNLEFCQTQLMLNYEREWQWNINNKPKLRTYIKWKFSFRVEKYIKLNLPKQHRSILAQLRRGLKLEERICKFCQLNLVESEYHFPLECSFYNEQRNQFMTKVGIDQDVFEAKELIRLLFKNSPRDIARFACSIF